MVASDVESSWFLMRLGCLDVYETESTLVDDNGACVSILHALEVPGCRFGRVFDYDSAFV